MPILINDEAFAVEVLQTRRASGADWYEEVWDGVYVMSPMADKHFGHADLSRKKAGPKTLTVSATCFYPRVGSGCSVR